MTDSNCLFCKIAKKEIPSSIIFEDEDFICFLDIHPINLGHTLVVPKKHSTTIYDTDDEVLKKVMPLVKKISIALKKATQANGINVMINNDSAAGQVIFHPHIHVIPRFNDDGFKHWQGKEVPSVEQFKEITEKIKKKL